MTPIMFHGALTVFCAVCFFALGHDTDFGILTAINAAATLAWATIGRRRS